METTPEWIAALRAAVEEEKRRREVAGEKRPPGQRDLAKKVNCKESVISGLLVRKPPKTCRFIVEISAYYKLALPQYRDPREADFIADARFLHDHDEASYEIVVQLTEQLVKQARSRSGRRSA